jgi:hypothetical protein
VAGVELADPLAAVRGLETGHSGCSPYFGGGGRVQAVLCLCGAVVVDLRWLGASARLLGRSFEMWSAGAQVTAVAQ